jgi:hypothetical protein
MIWQNPTEWGTGMAGEFKGEIVVMSGGGRGIGRVEDVGAVTLFRCSADVTVLIGEA